MKSEFLEALLSNELSDKHAEIVEKALREDRDLREAYYDQLEIDRALSVILSGESAEEVTESDFCRGVLARLQSEGADNERHFSRSVLTEIIEEREGVRPIRWPDLIKAGFVAAVASIALMFLLQTIIFREGRIDSQYADRKAGFIARVENVEEIEWSPRTAEIVREDGWLKSGLIEIESGIAKIAFNSGATVLVEGPASLSLETLNRAFLNSGKITAEVPKAASGFAINTPRLNVVDIGTRFGVEVDSAGNSEVHVMEGEVEASRSSGNAVSVLLREGLALRADGRTRSELAPIPYAGDLFTMQIGSNITQNPQLHFPFDEPGGSAILDSAGGVVFDTELEPGSDMNSSPLRSPGKSGGGLVFNKGQRLKTTLNSDFRVEAPHTVSMWIKIPPGMGSENGGTILRYGREGSSWTLSSNHSPESGAKGALCVSYGDGYVCGTTDIVDGQWHHIAYRFLGGYGTDVVSHVHLFVDGVAEPISGGRSSFTGSDRVEILTLGEDSPEGFSGWVDELKVYNSAISTRSIQSEP